MLPVFLKDAGSRLDTMTLRDAWRLVVPVACLFAVAMMIPAGWALSRALAQEAVIDAGAVNSMPVMLDARVVGDANRIRFIADLSGVIDISVSTLADPYRVVVDLPEVRFAMPESAGTEGRGLASAFRYGSISAGKSRIVIDVTRPVAVEKAFVVEPMDGQPARLVIDAIPTTREEFLVTARSNRPERPTTDGMDDPALDGGGLPVIVLDPGHGGIDTGAKGVGGTLEKEIVLSFGRVLGELLEESGRYNIVYTRRDDTFVPLGDRVKIARRNNAKLFISIHANSFSGADVRGAIIYTASDKASDRMAAELAASENQSDELAGIDVAAEDSDEVKDILIDLTRRETRNFGVVFAQNLIRELGKTTRMFKVPHQTAAFRVLEAPDVPSALIELGYLTNAADEKLLMSDKWQRDAAAAIVDAIDVYFGHAQPERRAEASP